MSRFLFLLVLPILSITGIFLIDYSNQEKQSKFIEENLIAEYIKQKNEYSSKYGSLTQESRKLSLFHFSCNELDCKAIVDLDNKKINTNFTFEKTNLYIPMISQFEAKITNVVFK